MEVVWACTRTGLWEISRTGNSLRSFGCQLLLSESFQMLSHNGGWHDFRWLHLLVPAASFPVIIHFPARVIFWETWQLRNSKLFQVTRGGFFCIEFAAAERRHFFSVASEHSQHLEPVTKQKRLGDCSLQTAAAHHQVVFPPIYIIPYWQDHKRQSDKVTQNSKHLLIIWTKYRWDLVDPIKRITQLLLHKSRPSPRPDLPRDSNEFSSLVSAVSLCLVRNPNVSQLIFASGNGTKSACDRNVAGIEKRVQLNSLVLGALSCQSDRKCKAEWACAENVNVDLMDLPPPNASQICWCRGKITLFFLDVLFGKRQSRVAKSRKSKCKYTLTACMFIHEPSHKRSNAFRQRKMLPGAISNTAAASSLSEGLQHGENCSRQVFLSSRTLISAAEVTHVSFWGHQFLKI